ncbi:MAG TPA: DUF4388 domain-containing protein [Polyangia bacterium]|jgi:hypothetical protein
MALQGDVKTVPLREVLTWLARGRASGILSVSRGMVVRQFHLRRGRVTLSGSTDQDMVLGHLLVERGVLERAQLEAALATHGGSRLRLGSVLARAGLVSTAALRAVLTEKVRLLLRDVLSWTDGDFFFDGGGVPRRSGVPASVGLAEVLALPVAAPLQTSASDALMVTDDDIVEIVEIAATSRSGAIDAGTGSAAER